MVHLAQGVTVRIITTGIPQKLPTYLSDEMIIKANKSNVADVWLAGQNVDSTNGVGLPISAGESTDPLHIPSLDELFIAGTAGDKIHIFIYDNPVLDKLNEILAKSVGAKSFMG